MVDDDTPPRPRVLLHVGSPKTGTSFLQGVLWGSREALREQGVLYPGTDCWDHFHAAVDLQGHFHGDPRPDLSGAWPALVEEVLAWRGTAVVSHEVLAGATPDDVARALRDLAGAEVHVVLTVRDPARLLPSRWQEDVKHGARGGFEEWWRRVRARDDDYPWSGLLWRTSDPLDVLDRWGALLPPGRLHVVTVPPPRSPGAGEAGAGDADGAGGAVDEEGGRAAGGAADRDALLWARFCEVAGLDPARADLTPATGANRALGAAEVELRRRVNVALEDALPPLVYQRSVKDVLAEVAGGRDGPGAGPRLPGPAREDVADLARAWVAGLRDRGVRVAGDLADLLPEDTADGARAAVPDAGGVAGAATPDEADVASAAVRTLAALLRRGADDDRDERLDRAEQEVRALIEERDARAADARRLGVALARATAERDLLAVEAARPRGARALAVRALRRAPAPVRRALLPLRARALPSLRARALPSLRARARGR